VPEASVRFCNTILTGVPSIIAGVAYGVIVPITKGFSAVAGGFALSVIMLPIVTLTTEQAFFKTYSHPSAPRRLGS